MPAENILLLKTDYFLNPGQELLFYYDDNTVYPCMAIVLVKKCLEQRKFNILLRFRDTILEDNFLIFHSTYCTETYDQPLELISQPHASNLNFLKSTLRKGDSNAKSNSTHAIYLHMTYLSDGITNCLIKISLIL